MQQIIDDELEDEIVADANEQQIYAIQQIEVIDLLLPLDETAVIFVIECAYIDLQATELLQ